MTPISMRGVPVFIDPYARLTHTSDDGVEVDVLCWVVDGSIRIHPDRWAAVLGRVRAVDPEGMP